VPKIEGKLCRIPNGIYLSKVVLTPSTLASAGGALVTSGRADDSGKKTTLTMAIRVPKGTAEEAAKSAAPVPGDG
jgi:hypothetical protein